MSRTSITMNNEFNLSAAQITKKGKSGKVLPTLNNHAVVLPVQVASFLPSLLGALPIMTGSGIVRLSPLEKAAMAAVSVAGRITINPVMGGFDINYLPSLLRVTNGSSKKNGVLNAQELREMIMALISKLLSSSGLTRTFYSQLLRQVMEDMVLSASLKGNQPNCVERGDPVNLNTGNFIYDKEDLVIKGRIPLSFKRFYNRLDQRKGCMGVGWRHNYEIQLLIEADRYTIIWDDGREEIYMRKEDGGIEPLFGCLCRLTINESSYSYHTQTGVLFSFNSAGLLTSTKDTNGMGLTFLYNNQRKLISVSNSLNSMLQYQYDRVTGNLISVCDHTGRTVALTYELSRLCKVENTLGESYQYNYGDDCTLYQIRNPHNICVLENKYDVKGRTVLQKFADGGEIRFDYQEDLNRTLVTDQNGGKIAYVHDEKFRNVKTISMDGEEKFSYNDRNLLVSKTDKKGNKTKYSYDDRGNTTQIIYPDGEKRNMTYDVDNRLLVLSVNGTEKQKNTYDKKGNLIKLSDALGRIHKIEYDENGKAIKLTQPDGSNMQFVYDSNGNIKQITDGAGNSTIYEYDNCNRVIKTTKGNGNSTRFSYDENNRITRVTNAAGDKRIYEYTKNGKLTKVMDFDGSVTIQEYNNMNQVKSVHLPDGGILRIEYDLMHNIKQKILPNGAEVSFTYDGLNRLEKMTLPTGGTISYEYDPNGNQIATIDPDGNRTSMEYDERNRLIKYLEPTGATTEYGYDMEGHLVSITNDKGKSYTYTYNEAGQIIRETDLLGNVNTYEYNSMGSLSCVIDPQKNKTYYEYGSHGWLSKLTYPDGHFEAYHYDKNGNMIQRENHKGEYMEFTYDTLDRVVKVKSSFGYEEVYSYNAVGKITSVTDTLGHVTRYVYSPGGKLTSIVDAAGNRSEYAYDAMGELIARCRHEGAELLLNAETSIKLVAAQKENKVQLTRYERNLLGKIETIINPLGLQEHYSYDLAGRMCKKTDRAGNDTYYTYNSVGGNEKITYADGKSVTLTYNSLRQLVQIQDWLGITQIEPDENGKAKKITDYKEREISYQWETMGEPKSLTYPDGTKITYEYDEQYRLNRLWDGAREVRYSYDENGHLSEKHLPNGIISQYGYNPMGLLSSLTHQKDGEILERYEYQYDLKGNKTATHKKRKTVVSFLDKPEKIEICLREENGHYEYRYDKLDRLTEVWKNRERISFYGYDAFGNRIRKQDKEGRINYHYNAANQLIREEGILPEGFFYYDERGNMTSVLRGTEEVNKYIYDESNRLVTAMDSKGRIAQYQYDGLNNRVGAKEYTTDILDVYNLESLNSGIAEKPVREIDYLLNLTKQCHNLLEKTEKTAESSIRQSFVWDSNAVFMKDEENVYSYLQDDLGSTVRFVNLQDEQQILYGYDEFGRDLYGTSGKGQPFGYTGYQKDDIANTYYAQAREYLPALGRFDKEDAIRRGINWYAYCDGNPLKYVDPLGLDAILINKKLNSDVNAGIEHMSGFFQASNTDWNFFYWGNDGVRYEKIDDPNIFDSMDTMNQYLFDHKLYELENRPYIDSVYIKGDFSSSHAEAQKLYDVFYNSGKEENENYDVLNANCGQVTMDLFQKGILPGGKTVADYINSKGQVNAVIPNWNMINMQRIFYNSSLNVDGFNKAMQTLFERYEKYPILNGGLKKDYDMIAGCSE